MTTDAPELWDATNFASKDNLLRVIRQEANGLFQLAESHWQGVPVCGTWEVRDLIGHMVDVTEGYVSRFKVTRSGGTAEPIAPLRDMAKVADVRAMSHRSESQTELLKRLREGFDELQDVFGRLNEREWSNFTVVHGFMGPLPAFIYPVFQVMDYGVHGWDIREGYGMANSMTADVADLLMPFMFVLWQTTLDTDLVTERTEIGFRVSGRNAGTWRVVVSPEGYEFERRAIDDLAATFEFDPASLVLTAFGRVSAGTAYGDQATARRYRSLFFRI